MIKEKAQSCSNVDLFGEIKIKYEYKEQLDFKVYNAPFLKFHVKRLEITKLLFVCDV